MTELVGHKKSGIEKMYSLEVLMLAFCVVVVIFARLGRAAPHCGDHVDDY